jgi:hypothetical protein
MSCGNAIDGKTPVNYGVFTWNYQIDGIYVVNSREFGL